MAKMSSPQKDDKNPHTKLKMTKMSHHQKRWQKSRTSKKDGKICRTTKKSHS